MICDLCRKAPAPSTVRRGPLVWGVCLGCFPRSGDVSTFIKGLQPPEPWTCPVCCLDASCTPGRLVVQQPPGGLLYVHEACWPGMASLLAMGWLAIDRPPRIARVQTPADTQVIERMACSVCQAPVCESDWRAWDGRCGPCHRDHLASAPG